MRVDIRDAESVRPLRPLEVASYLRATGWRQEEKSEGEFAIWIIDGDVEVFLPLRSDRSDFSLRMGDLLRTLSVLEDRSQAELLADLFTPHADTIRFRLVDEDLNDGSMPIEDYAHTSQKTRDLLAAAACSAIQPRAVLPNRRPDQVLEYLRGVRMGQTERGSYVLKILSPVPPELVMQQKLDLGEDTVDDSDPPYARQVTQTLVTGLAKAEAAAASAASDGTIDAFVESVPNGVSANFCEALAGVAEFDDSTRRVEVSFSWSRTRPISSVVSSKVTITPDRVVYLREAARVMRDRSPVEQFQLAGPVTKLERATSAGAGQVTIGAVIDGQPKRIRVELSESDYSLAIKAHEQGNDLSCHGRLLRQSRSFVLQDPSEVEIWDADE